MTRVPFTPPCRDPDQRSSACSSRSLNWGPGLKGILCLRQDCSLFITTRTQGALCLRLGALAKKGHVRHGGAKISGTLRRNPMNFKVKIEPLLLLTAAAAAVSFCAAYRYS